MNWESDYPSFAHKHHARKIQSDDKDWTNNVDDSVDEDTLALLSAKLANRVSKFRKSKEARKLNKKKLKANAKSKFHSLINFLTEQKAHSNKENKYIDHSDSSTLDSTLIDEVSRAKSNKRFREAKKPEKASRRQRQGDNGAISSLGCSTDSNKDGEGERRRDERKIDITRIKELEDRLHLKEIELEELFYRLLNINLRYTDPGYIEMLREELSDIVRSITFIHEDLQKLLLSCPKSIDLQHKYKLSFIRLINKVVLLFGVDKFS